MKYLSLLFAAVVMFSTAQAQAADHILGSEAEEEVLKLIPADNYLYLDSLLENSKGNFANVLKTLTGLELKGLISNFYAIFFSGLLSTCYIKKDLEKTLSDRSFFLSITFQISFFCLAERKNGYFYFWFFEEVTAVTYNCYRM